MAKLLSVSSPGIVGHKSTAVVESHSSSAILHGAISWVQGVLHDVQTLILYHFDKQGTHFIELLFINLI